MPQVLILMGSDSDAPVMQAAVDVLNEFGISNEMTVASAHRSPARVMTLVERRARPRRQAVHRRRRRRGASWRCRRRAHDAAGDRRTDRFVGAQGDGRAAVDRADAAGVPVATVSIGKPGATNAGVLAAQILGVADQAMAAKLVRLQERSSRTRSKPRRRASASA